MPRESLHFDASQCDDRAGVVLPGVSTRATISTMSFTAKPHRVLSYPRSVKRAPGVLLALVALLFVANPAVSDSQPRPLRVATFNASLSFDQAGALIENLETGDFEPARHAAAIIQSVRPDVILLNEFDYDDQQRAAAAFRTRYLEKAQFGQAPILYPYVHAAPVNTGELAEVDINGDGELSLPADALGFGLHPGHYGMIVLSRYPLQPSRTFREFRWHQMPENLLPWGYYGEEAARHMRLSSKSHWDILVELPFVRPLHLLAAHPTPPVFDGPEDRNGRRNHDEIRFWAEYLSGAQWIVDDAGHTGGLGDGEHFVILGDLNADPCDGDSYNSPVRLLLEHPRVQTERTPRSDGAVAKSLADGGVNEEHGCPAAEDTGDFGDTAAGNLRVDYVLPGQSLSVIASGVFWPVGSPWIQSSDHRLVWVDVILPQ